MYQSDGSIELQGYLQFGDFAPCVFAWCSMMEWNDSGMQSYSEELLIRRILLLSKATLRFCPADVL